MHFHIARVAKDAFRLQVVMDDDELGLESRPFQDETVALEAVEELIKSLRVGSVSLQPAGDEGFQVLVAGSDGTPLATGPEFASPDEVDAQLTRIRRWVVEDQDFRITYPPQRISRRVRTSATALEYDFEQASASGEAGLELLRRASDNAFTAHFNDESGSPLVRLRGFATQHLRDKKVRSLLKTLADERRYRRHSTSDGSQTYFVIKSRNGRELARSRMFADDDQLAAAIQWVVERGAALASRSEGATRRRQASKAVYNLDRLSAIGEPGIERYRGEDGNYYFHLNDESGAGLFLSHGYRSKSARDNGVRAFTLAAAQRESYRERDEGGYLEIAARNGRTIARSRTFATREELERAIAWTCARIPRIGRKTGLEKIHSRVLRLPVGHESSLGPGESEPELDEQAPSPALSEQPSRALGDDERASLEMSADLRKGREPELTDDDSPRELIPPTRSPGKEEPPPPVRGARSPLPEAGVRAPSPAPSETDEALADTTPTPSDAPRDESPATFATRRDLPKPLPSPAPTTLSSALQHFLSPAEDRPRPSAEGATEDRAQASPERRHRDSSPPAERTTLTPPAVDLRRRPATAKSPPKRGVYPAMTLGARPSIAAVKETTPPKPTSPEPTSPEPTSPEPTSPEPTSPEPTSPEPTSPEPTSPEPTLPGPTSARPTSPEPTPLRPLAAPVTETTPPQQTPSKPPPPIPTSPNSSTTPPPPKSTLRKPAPPQPTPAKPSPPRPPLPATATPKRAMPKRQRASEPLAAPPPLHLRTGRAPTDSTAEERLLADPPRSKDPSQARLSALPLPFPANEHPDATPQVLPTRTSQESPARDIPGSARIPADVSSEMSPTDALRASPPARPEEPQTSAPSAARGQPGSSSALPPSAGTPASTPHTTQSNRPSGVTGDKAADLEKAPHTTQTVVMPTTAAAARQPAPEKPDRQGAPPSAEGKKRPPETASGVVLPGRHNMLLGAYLLLLLLFLILIIIAPRCGPSMCGPTTSDGDPLLAKSQRGEDHELRSVNSATPTDDDGASAGNRPPRHAGRTKPPPSARSSDRSGSANNSRGLDDADATPDLTSATPPSPDQCPSEPSTLAGALISPPRPSAGSPMSILGASQGRDLHLTIRLVSSDGRPLDEPLASKVLPGLPPATLAFGRAPRDGLYTMMLIADGEPISCEPLRVSSGAQGEERLSPTEADHQGGITWPVERAWTPAEEALYSAWLRQLFNGDDDPAWSVERLDIITSDPTRNLLHGSLGLGEDRAHEDGGLLLKPDCADLPYYLRAYFSWKRRLPFAFRICSRGRPSSPPRCGKLRSNLDLPTGGLSRRSELSRAQRFFQRTIAWGVHTGNGRTALDDQQSDFYPLRLDREALTPGTIFADPYGHILLLTESTVADESSPGGIYAVDGQPDGTIRRKRFSRSSFLWDPDPTLGSAAFKRFRPVVAGPDGVEALDDASLRQLPGDAGLWTDYASLTVSDFYTALESIAAPPPWDPSALQHNAVDAIAAAARARVQAIENGMDYTNRHPATIPMPRGFRLFETSGPWEDYSTPSRDLRLLIALHTLDELREDIRRHPELYRLRGDVDSELSALQDDLDHLLRDPQYSLEYRRSDGSPWALTIPDLLERRTELERGYNPNDCPEVRWGAPPGSDEATTCTRRAPSAQRARMEKYRVWFRNRRPPPRGTTGI